MTRASRIFDRILNGTSSAPRTPMHAMTVRPMKCLLDIRDQHDGSAFLAALSGEINAEEYLKLEKLREH